MILPYPFSRGVVICGEPIYVKRYTSTEQMEELCQQLDVALNLITAEADNYSSK